MSDGKSSFVYVTYIRTTPEELWDALTTPGFMRKYWFGMHIETDWSIGSAWALKFEDGRVADGGEVLECDRPRKLVLRWKHQLRPELAEEGPALCTMELEPQKGAVKLTVTHSIDRTDSQLITAVSGGWPSILSSLKSLLETGQPLERRP